MKSYTSLLALTVLLTLPLSAQAEDRNCLNVQRIFAALKDKDAVTQSQHAIFLAAPSPSGKFRAETDRAFQLATSSTKARQSVLGALPRTVTQNGCKSLTLTSSNIGADDLPDLKPEEFMGGFGFNDRTRLRIVKASPTVLELELFDPNQESFFLGKGDRMSIERVSANHIRVIRELNSASTRHNCGELGWVTEKNRVAVIRNIYLRSQADGEEAVSMLLENKLMDQESGTAESRDEESREYCASISNRGTPSAPAAPTTSVAPVEPAPAKSAE